MAFITVLTVRYTVVKGLPSYFSAAICHLIRARYTSTLDIAAIVLQRKERSQISSSGTYVIHLFSIRTPIVPLKL